MLIKLAWRNIWRNSRRTLITMAAIGFAVFFACLMQSIQFGSYDRMIENAVRFYSGYIQIHEQGYWDERSLDKSMALHDSLLTPTAQTQHVVALIPRLESFSLVSHELKTRGAMVNGIDPEKETQLTRLQEKLVEGQYLEAQDRAVLLSGGLASYLEVSPGDSVVMLGQGYHGTNAVGKYPVKGIVKFPAPDLNDRLLMLPLQEAQYLFGAEGRITSLALLVDDPEHVEQVAGALRTKLPSEAYEVMGWREMMPEMVQQIELDYASGLILLYILYLIIAFGIFGTFLMMTKEREYEFGILMAVGMHRWKLQAVVALEIILLSLTGTLAGIVLSLPLLLYFYQHPITFSGDYAKVFEQFGMEPILPLSLDPGIFLQQALIVVLIALVLGGYPLYVIWKLKVAPAIRAS